jgi:hypothetical protein
VRLEVQCDVMVFSDGGKYEALFLRSPTTPTTPTTAAIDSSLSIQIQQQHGGVKIFVVNI